MSSPIYLGRTGTLSEADLQLLWTYITGQAALPVGLETLNLASFIRNNRVFNVADYGAKGGALELGETEDDRAATNTVAFRNAFTAVSANGGGEVRVPGGTYVVQVQDTISTQSIRPVSNSRLRLDPDACLKAPATSLPNYSIVYVYGVQNVEIVGGQLDGNRNAHVGSTGEGGHCISILGSQRVRTHDTIIKNAWGDGTYVDSDLYGGGHGVSEDVTFADCLVDGNRRNGISFSGTRRFSVGGCVIRATNGTAPQAGVLVEQSSGPGDVQDGTISGNVIQQNTGVGVALTNPAVGGINDPFRVAVTGNVFINNGESVTATPGAIANGCIIAPNLLQTGETQRWVFGPNEFNGRLKNVDDHFETIEGKGLLTNTVHSGAKVAVRFLDSGTDDICTVGDNQPVQIGASSVFLSGSGAPDNAVGLNGWFYFRTGTPGTSNQRLYVKSAGAWVGIV